jgi:hypothetical protein
MLVTEEFPSRSQLALQSLTLVDCSALTDRVASLLRHLPKLVLEMSDCQEIDEPGMQFLSLLTLDPDIADRIQWRNPHPNVVARAHSLGMADWLKRHCIA